MVMATGGSNLSEKTVDAQASFDLMSGHLIGKDGATVSQIFDTKLDELKESGWTTYTHPGTHVRPETALFGYDIFAQLAGHAASENPSLTLSANFYDKPSTGSSVFADIVKFDHDSQGYSTRLAKGGNPGLYQLCGCDPNLPADKALQRFDPVQAALELSDTPDGLGEKSAPILHQSEENRLGALRRVLDSNIDFDPVESVEKVGKPYDKDAEPMSMVRYLVAWRGGAQFGDRAFYDQGEALVMFLLTRQGLAQKFSSLTLLITKVERTLTRTKRLYSSTRFGKRMHFIVPRLRRIQWPHIRRGWTGIITSGAWAIRLRAKMFLVAIVPI